jgi:hypothetical protein
LFVPLLRQNEVITYSHERELLAKFPFTFRGYVILQAADSMVSISTEIYSILDPPADGCGFYFSDVGEELSCSAPAHRMYQISFTDLTLWDAGLHPDEG